MKKILYTMVAFFCVAFALQSCFQDMDHPAFDYPESSGEKEYSPMKMDLNFNNNDLRDKGVYGFNVYSEGSSSFSDDAVEGQAYQGALKSYMIAGAPSYLKDTIPCLGSFTVAFWMKSEKNTVATGLFSLSNTKTYWANIDIMLENHSSATDARFKIHLLNVNGGTTQEKWMDQIVANVFGEQWVHMAFKYDENTSTVSIYRNGEVAVEQTFEGLGKLKFENVGSIVIGGFHFSPVPSLTEGCTTAPSWAGTYTGLMDQFHFYDVALSGAEIQRLYNEKG